MKKEKIKEKIKLIRRLCDELQAELDDDKINILITRVMVDDDIYVFGVYQDGYPITFSQYTTEEKSIDNLVRQLLNITTNWLNPLRVLDERKKVTLYTNEMDEIFKHKAWEKIGPVLNACATDDRPLVVETVGKYEDADRLIKNFQEEIRENYGNDDNLSEGNEKSS